MTKTFEQNPYELARLAECFTPDRLDSAGAEFLRSVRIAVEEASVTSTPDEVREEIFELVDGCVPNYTHPRWLTFVDLGAYEEDISDYSTENLTEAAGIALLTIGERLAFALVEQYENEEETEENNGED